MFPNFTSIAQRERKRLELLEKAQRRVQQADAKRELYSETAWSSDQGKGINVNQNSVTQSSQTTSTESTTTESTSEPVSQDQQNIDSTLDTEGRVATARLYSDASTEPLSSVSFASTESQATAGLVTSGSQAKPDVSTIGSQAKPDTSTSASQAKPDTSTSASQAKPEVTTKETQTKRELSEEDIDAIRFIRKHYKIYPEWAVLKIPPLTKDGQELAKYYIGKSGYLYRRDTNKCASPSKVDWEATAENVAGRFYDEQSNIVDELDTMKLEDRDALDYRFWLKRRGETLEKPEKSDPVRFTRGTDTGDDQRWDQSSLIWLLRLNQAKFNEANIIIHPVYDSGSTVTSDKAPKLFKLQLKRNESKPDELQAIRIKTDENNPTILKLINWSETVKSILAKAKKNRIDINFDRVGYKEIRANKNRFKPANELFTAAPGVSVGSAKTDIRYRVDIPASDAKRFITDFLREAHDRDGIVPIQLPPVIVRKDKAKEHRNYYLAWYPAANTLRIRDGSKKNDSIIKSNKLFFSHIEWTYTLDVLIEVMEVLRKELGDVNSINRAQAKTIRDTLALFEEVAIRNGISAIKSKVDNETHDMEDVEDFSNRQDDRAVKQTMNDMVKRVSGSGLKGRGLRGAGLLPGGQCIPNKKPKGEPVYANIKRGGNGRYNLNDIQGTALASAFIYKQIGSKYIRIPELNNQVLYIVRPSREKMGPRRGISKGLTEMLKDLVYNQNISQAAYHKLPIEDHKLFKEILRITHIQHVFTDELPDPLGNLRMEYDKLKGEVMLGNNNPDSLKS